MSFIHHPVFETLFDAPIPRIILKADSPNFTILRYNMAYQKISGLHSRDVIGWHLMDAFDPKKAGIFDDRYLLDMLEKSLKTNMPLTTEPFRFDVAFQNLDVFVEKWWQIDILPFDGTANHPLFLLLTANDVTEDKI
jgi:hypothetical protein